MIAPGFSQIAGEPGVESHVSTHAVPIWRAGAGSVMDTLLDGGYVKAPARCSSVSRTSAPPGRQFKSSTQTGVSVIDESGTRRSGAP